MRSGGRARVTALATVAPSTAWRGLAPASPECSCGSPSAQGACALKPKGAARCVPPASSQRAATRPVAPPPPGTPACSPAPQLNRWWRPVQGVGFGPRGSTLASAHTRRRVIDGGAPRKLRVDACPGTGRLRPEDTLQAIFIAVAIMLGKADHSAGWDQHALHPWSPVATPNGRSLATPWNSVRALVLTVAPSACSGSVHLPAPTACGLTRCGTPAGGGTAAHSKNAPCSS